MARRWQLLFISCKRLQQQQYDAVRMNRGVRHVFKEDMSINTYASVRFAYTMGVSVVGLSSCMPFNNNPSAVPSVLQ